MISSGNSITVSVVILPARLMFRRAISAISTDFPCTSRLRAPITGQEKKHYVHNHEEQRAKDIQPMTIGKIQASTCEQVSAPPSQLQTNFMQDKIGRRGSWRKQHDNHL